MPFYNSGKNLIVSASEIELSNKHCMLNVLWLNQAQTHSKILSLVIPQRHQLLKNLWLCANLFQHRLESYKWRWSAKMQTILLLVYFLHQFFCFYFYFIFWLLSLAFVSSFIGFRINTFFVYYHSLFCVLNNWDYFYWIEIIHLFCESFKLRCTFESKNSFRKWNNNNNRQMFACKANPKSCFVLTILLSDHLR